MLNKSGYRWIVTPYWKLVFLVLLCFSFNYSVNAQINTDDHNLAVDLICEADTLIKIEQYLQAIENLEKAIELDSVIKEQYVLLTKACFCAKKLATAKKYLRKAKQIFF